MLENLLLCWPCILKKKEEEEGMTLNFCALKHQPSSSGTRCPQNTLCPFDFSGLADLDTPDIIQIFFREWH